MLQTEMTMHAAWRKRAEEAERSITAACEGTGCVNAHELAEALKAARQLIADHCQDEEKVRAILAEFDRSDSYGSDGPIELAERAAEALRQARAERDQLRANIDAVVEALGAFSGKCDDHRNPEAEALLDYVKKLKQARRERDEARAQLDTYIKTAADAVAEQGRLERALASAVAERDASILREAIGEGSHRKICDDLISLRGSFAPLHAESADRLRIIEEVAAVIGFKYPSECRDMLAKRVREKIEACEAAGRVLAKAIANIKDTRDWPELSNTRQAGLFCGVEDHDLSDRYEGARYGYQDALERCDEFVRNAVSDVDANPLAIAWVKAAQEASNG